MRLKIFIKKIFSKLYQQVLVVKTGLSKDEVEKLHEEFIAENPEGVINMEKYVSSHKV